MSHIEACEICDNETDGDRCLSDGAFHCDDCIGACHDCADVMREDQLIEAADARRKGEL